MLNRLNKTILEVKEKITSENNKVGYYLGKIDFLEGYTSELDNEFRDGYRKLVDGLEDNIKLLQEELARLEYILNG